MSLVVLAVDDEQPAVDELAYLLGAHQGVGEVRTATDSASALRLLEDGAFHAVFLDIRMPGLDGLDLARVLSRFANPPKVVFVTAHESAAVDAFAIGAVDYLLKPLSPDRLAEAVRRVVASTSRQETEQSVAVELAGTTRLIGIGDIRYVEAHGDYARLYTATSSHLVRVPMGILEERWGAQGFVRVHRSYLVATAHISELRADSRGGHVVLVEGKLLPVSRRHSRELKERLVGRARGQARQ